MTDTTALTGYPVLNVIILAAIVVGSIGVLLKFGQRFLLEPFVGMVRREIGEPVARIDAQTKSNGGDTDTIADRQQRVEDTVGRNSRALSRVEAGQHAQDADRGRIGRDVTELSGQMNGLRDTMGELSDAHHRHIEHSNQLVADYQASLAEHHSLTEHGEADNAD
jgi:hypothetical protein